MLAPKDLPTNFDNWNRQYKVPSGELWWAKYVRSKIRGGNFLWRNRYKLPHWLIKQIGFFGFQVQPITSQRVFEYPWCFFVTPLEAGMSVIELGAGASGFQFVLAENALDVTSVDPLINPSGKVDWIFTIKEFNHLNNAFGGKVKFIQNFLENAQLEGNSFDRIFSISVIEHIPPEAIKSLVKEIHRVLKPGGLFIATIDLFLDCQPFTNKPSNKLGSNISIRSLVEDSGLKIKVGNLSELYGYPEFEPERIRQQLDKYFIWNNILTQCIVLEKVV